MAHRQKTVPEIIVIAKMSMAIAAMKVSDGEAETGKVSDNSIYVKIYNELKAVEFWYETAPSSETTRRCANYLYALCFPYNKEAEKIQANLELAKPVISGPADDTVTDGETASFTIAVVSDLPYTIKWYRDGVEISGATGLTYSFTASYASDNGATFSAVAISAAGSAISRTATLTVTTALVGQYYIGDTDYYTDLNNGFDNVAYIGSFDIPAVGEPISIDIVDELLANNKYHVYKHPTSWGEANTWFNTALNNGQIPDQVFRTLIVIGDYRYIVSRVAMSFDVTAPMVFSGDGD
jgi:hypothetical protein